MTSPATAIPISTYAQLADAANGFARGAFNLLIVLGPPGVAKTSAIRGALESQPHLWIDSHVTPCGLFTALESHRDKPVVVDDVDGLYRDSAHVRLLKALCSTTPSKRLSWLSGSRRGGEPTSFETRSRTCLIMNQWKTLNEDVLALEDRGIVMEFRPSAAEVHAFVGRWFGNAEVLRFMAQRLPLITRPSIRHYLRGDELHRANWIAWQSMLESSLGLDPRAAAIISLRSDPAHETEGSRVAAFTAAGHGDRATYFRLKRRLAPVGRAGEPPHAA